MRRDSFESNPTIMPVLFSPFHDPVRPSVLVLVWSAAPPPFNHLSYVRLVQLLRKGADVSRRDPTSQHSVLDVAVSSACPTSRARIVKSLLEAKADPNGGGGTENRSTPLHTACRADSDGGVGALEALLEGGADADVPPPCRGRRMLRPLHIAAVHGNAEAVSALTLKGCRLDVKTLDPSRYDWCAVVRIICVLVMFFFSCVLCVYVCVK